VTIRLVKPQPASVLRCSSSGRPHSFWRARIADRTDVFRLSCRSDCGSLTGSNKGKENEAIYAGCRRLGLFFASLGGARGDEFETVSQPSFAAIEARLVYGAVDIRFLVCREQQ